MGITHFAGLGKAPGAVTAALSYLKNEVGDDPEYGKIVENVVIFTSPEIANGSERAIESYDNAYMERGKCKGWTRGLINSFEIVKRFIFNEFEDVGLYLCEVNVNDFSNCFEAIAKALLKFHPPSRVGKHVWVNITGGTNILNAALMQVAHLSGLIPIIYYTFVANRDDNKYLKPFSKNENEFK
ncbi:MAG: hypothetical protein N3F06_02835, partial [Nitrososphaerales archaeon]|nr:hypothetical protein [Nitrososphaerales archaeon]